MCTEDRLETCCGWGAKKSVMKHGFMQPYKSDVFYVFYIRLNQEMNMQNFLDAFQQ